MTVFRTFLVTCAFATLLSACASAVTEETPRACDPNCYSQGSLPSMKL